MRHGIALANPGLRVSGIAEIRPPRPESTRDTPSDAADRSENEGPGEAWLVSAEERASGPRPLPFGPPAEDSGTGAAPLSAGAFFGLADEPVEEDGPEGPGIGSKAHSREELAQGSISALMGAQQTIIAAEPEKMPPNYVAPDPRRRRDEAVPVVPVRCFRCHHVQEVSRYAKSTQCERCSVYISLADYEIKTVKCHTLRTRGNVVIARRGGLVNGSEIACHHLTVNGSIDATVDCSGDAVFRRSGTARGRLHCDKLVIERGCEVRFPDGVFAQRAEISGRLVGDLTCSGKVRLFRHGSIEGDLRAVELEQREGGHIAGETLLDSATSTTLALRKGFNPSVIG